MTGYTVHTGSNRKFREGWDKIFGDNSGKSKAQAKKKSGPKQKSGKKAT